MSYNIDEVDLIFDEFDERVAKVLNNFKNEMRSIRAGRANNMANISVPEARLLVIAPWDKSQLKAIEKAILAGNIGINPNNDGQVIRLVFPELTEERRRSTVKEAKTLVEESKVVMRNARRDAIDELKKMQKASTITEDDLKNLTADIDKKLSAHTDDVDKLFKDKEQEILSI